MRADGVSAVRIIWLAGALLVCASVASGDNAGAVIDWGRAERVDVRMLEYEFVPDQLRFRHGVPYQLHLINAGKEGHDFTAPDFFNAVDVRDADALGAGKNSIYVKPGETADIYFIADKAGLFAPRCADHDWAGMKATIIVD
jgi:plastocyanin